MTFRARVAGTLSVVLCLHGCASSVADAGIDAGGDALPLCGVGTASIRYAFAGEAAVDACAPVTFTVEYRTYGTAPTISCIGPGAIAAIMFADVPTGRMHWQFSDFGRGADWYSHLGRAAVNQDTDLVLNPGPCLPGPGGSGPASCRYSSYIAAGEGGGCSMTVRRAATTAGALVDVVLSEACPLIHGVDRAQRAPTIEALHILAPVQIQTVNGADPSQPPPFECPL